MPLVFDEPNLGQPDLNHLREAHNISAVRGPYNITDERLAGAIAIWSRKPSADRKNGA